MSQTVGTTLSNTSPATFSAQMQTVVDRLRALQRLAGSASLAADIDTVATADAAFAAAVHPSAGRADKARVRAAYTQTESPAVAAAGQRMRAAIHARCNF